jgi:ABC-type transport system substrate-binding protein
MQDKKLIVSMFFATLILLATAAPSAAFIYPDGSQDDLFETYGPRIDQILIKKYNSLQSEINALKAGEIDFTDWALEKAMIDDLSTDPNIQIVGYGGEVGYYTFNYNNNPNQYLGNPPNPLYPNPKYGNNPTEVKEFRQACSYLLDRPAICTGPGQGMYEPIYTPIPAYMTCWIHPDISYTGLLSAYAYPPSVANAAAKLNAAHMILTGSPDGYRYWDKNLNGAKDAGEDLVIDLYSRADAARRGAADMLEAGFADPLIKVQFTDTPGGGGVAWQKCMVEKDYHMYTSGWIYIGPDPDYLFDLYHWDNYYHPEDPPNFGAISQYNPALQDALRNVKYAPDALSAQAAAYVAQEEFAADACETPLASTSSPKAYNKWYTGGNDGAAKGDAEDKYRGKMWTHIVNEKGKGENSWFTTQNAYPAAAGENDLGYFYGDGNMIMRYGWCDNTMPRVLNPMYSSWYWEFEVLDRVYDSLGKRDPTTKSPVFVPQLAQNWTVGSWYDPKDGLTKAKIHIVLRPEILWSDGVELTSDDVIYTFITMPSELRAKGCHSVWWQSTINQIAGFYKLDDNTVDILLKTSDLWSVNQIISNIIVPKHIWQPYIALYTVSEIESDFSNQPAMLVGTGPFLMGANTPETLTMTRNPLYYNTLESEVIVWQHDYGVVGYTYAQGIRTTAVAPSTQISEGKIRDDGTGHGKFNVVVPVTNFDLKNTNIEHVVINIVSDMVAGDTIALPLGDYAGEVFTPGQTKYYTFNNVVLPKGFYDINVTLEITGGTIYDYVHNELPPNLWKLFLGPISVGPEPRIAASWDFAITVPGDLNGNGIVDIFDIVPIAVIFGSRIGYANYKSSGDLNHDGRIDIFDIVLVAIDFTWTCPPPIQP